MGGGPSLDLGGQVRGGQDADLTDTERREGPSGDLRRGSERRAAEVEVQGQVHPVASDRDDQDERLEDDPQCRRPRQHPELGAGEVLNLEDLRARPPQGQERPQSGDGDDVVDDGGPHVGPEDPPGVEELAEQVVEAVEEDLGQAQQAEEDRQAPGLGTQTRGSDDDEEGREDHREERDAEEDRARQRDQLVDVGVSPTGLQGTHDLGHEDRVEDAGGEEVVDRVGQGVGRLERAGHAACGGTDGGQEEHRTDQTRDARDQGPRCHDHAGAQERGTTGCTHLVGGLWGLTH